MDSHGKRIQSLSWKLYHPDPHIRRRAARDLQLLLMKAPSWLGPRERAITAEELGRIGGEDAIEALCGALWDPHSEVRQAAAAALGAIAERHPTPALRAALPRLRRLAWRWPDDSLDYLELLASWLPANEKARQVYRIARERIEAATELPLPAEAPRPSPEELPLPAAAPRPSPEELPVPAEAPAEGLESLPIPADVSASPPAGDRRAQNVRPARSRSGRRWWSRFGSLLHPGGR
jgi:HEAT repeats